MKRISGLLWPLVLPPLVFWLAAEDYVSFGGGDKDIFLALPLLAFALFYLPAYGIFWRRGHGPGAAAWRGAVAAFLVLAAVWVAALTWMLARA